MDASRFTDAATGELVSIDSGRDWAFLPSKLPDNWSIPPHLASKWADAREILGELRGTARTLPDPALLLRPLRQREAIRSSSLEGTYATPEDLLAYERNPRDPSSSEDPANTWREVFNYQRVLEYGQDMIDQGHPLSEWLVRQMHQILLSGVRGEDKSPGEIRGVQVHVGVGHRYNPPPKEHLSQLLGDLERAIQSRTQIHPLIHALMVHYQFEAIHPFRDGNGRLGRILLALLIYKGCGFDRPTLFLSEFFERHRDDYIDALFSVSATGDWPRWVGLGLEATIETGGDTIRRIRRLLEIREDYEARIREHQGRDRLMHLVPQLLSKPIITYQDLMAVLEVSYPTARGDMDALVAMNIVRELTSYTHPKRFLADEIFQVAYFDDEARP